MVAARFALGGRSPYSPDVVFVHEFAMKPFVEAVITHASKYLAGENGAARSLTRRSSRSTLMEAVKKDQSARVLVSGSNWGVVEVQDRTETLAATYAFAAPSSAKYLTQFIDAHISWVNHAPSHMLIGPALPRNTPLTQTRYTKSQFEVPRPQLIAPVSNSVDTILGGTSKADQLWRDAIAPLPSTKQRPGFKIGFFEQGIITGGLITLGSLVATVSTVGYYVWILVRG
ncbi:hypothetical protein LTR66_017039 [Elasticomyces elasticus]|nr:hypothetical protein LTR66_017039 [Elasticomyces elasticus]